MSRRARSAPKVNVSPSVRLGLESIVEGNETTIRAMLSLGSDKVVVEGLIDCMGVNSLSAEMLIANYFSASMLGAYCRERIGKSDKGGAATLAERIAREWAKPSFAPLPAPADSKKRKEPQPPVEDAAAKRAAALAEVAAKRAKQAAQKQASSPTAPAAEPKEKEVVGQREEEEEEEDVYDTPDAREIAALEACEDIEQAVGGLARRKLRCDAVLAGLVRWDNCARAAEFLRAWEESEPLFGCDLELCFEAVPRIKLKSQAEMAKAGAIVGLTFPEADEEYIQTYAGEWDPDEIGEREKQAFMEALEGASMGTANDDA